MKPRFPVQDNTWLKKMVIQVIDEQGRSRELEGVKIRLVNYDILLRPGGGYGGCLVIECPDDAKAITFTPSDENGITVNTEWCEGDNAHNLPGWRKE